MLGLEVNVEKIQKITLNYIKINMALSHRFRSDGIMPYVTKKIKTKHPHRNSLQILLDISLI